jgi:two-component system, NarL family, sensor histidine kinase UhpB
MQRCFYFMAICWALWCTMAQAHGANDTLDLNQAQRSPGTLAQTQPLQTSAEQRVSLPDSWWNTWPQKEGISWYRLRFDRPDLTEPLFGLYIRKICSTADIYLNGSLIYSGGPMTEPVPRWCFMPQLISLPQALVKPQDNVLEIKLYGYALEKVSLRQRSAELSEIKIGPYTKMAGLYAEQDFLSVVLLKALGIFTSLLALMLLWFGVVNRREPEMIYLGFLMLGWNFLTLRVLVIHWGLDNASIERLVCVGYGVVSWLTVQFFKHQGRLKCRPLVTWMSLQCALVVLSLFSLGDEKIFLISTAWYLLFLFEIIFIAALYIVRHRKTHSQPFKLIGVVILVLAGLLLLDQLVQLSWLNLMQLNIVHFLMPLFFAAFALQKLHSFARSFLTLEGSQASLKERVAQATAKMEQNFAEMAQLRVEQITAKERKRIAGDLHDDLGAKLLTIVHTSESERISSLAREALEEMRLSVKGLTGRPMQVADALADWRAETVMRLGQAGVEAQWSSPTQELTQELSARVFVQTTRILREAVSNVIKHSGASHCKVDCALSATDFILTIQDNGKGIAMELDGQLDRGHGMASMKHRAKQMQGQCLVESGPGYGTVIRLSLPL